MRNEVRTITRIGIQDALVTLNGYEGVFFFPVNVL
jgi:hypothetical protein